jgi:transposase
MEARMSENVRKYPVPPDSKEQSITFLTRKADLVTRVYLTVQKVYIKNKQYNNNKRIAIGKLDYKLPPDWKETGKRPTQMIPNDNYADYFPEYKWCDEEEAERVPPDTASTENIEIDDFEPPFSDSVKVGSYLIIKATIKKLKLRELLASSFTETEINRIFDFVSYMVINEDNSAFHFSGYAFEHALFETEKGISDETLGRLFGTIDVNKINTFMNKWNESIMEGHKKSDVKKVYLSADGTNSSSQAGQIDLVEYGASKIEDGNPIINMMLIVDMLSKLPISYDMYNGSINDMSECTYMLNQILEMNYMAFGIILDRGFFSRENIAYFDEHHLDFIIMAKGWKRFIRNVVLEVVSTFENKQKYYIPRYGVYGTTTKGELFDAERYIHVYFNPDMVGKEQNAQREKIENWENKLVKLKQTQEHVDLRSLKYIEDFFDIKFYEKKDENDKVLKRTIVDFNRKEDEIDKEFSLSGHFVIVTSEEMDAKTALFAYKSRDINEKLNAVSKSFLGNTSYRVSDKDHLKGKGFIVFLGMIIRQSIFLSLQKEEDKKGKPVQLFEVPRAIDELEKISVIKYANGKYSQRVPLTRAQKTIIKAFGYSNSTATETIKQVAERLTSVMENAKKSFDAKHAGVE